VHCAPGIILSFFRDMADSVFVDQFPNFEKVKDLPADQQAEAFAVTRYLIFY
jgi:hypothetical protein